MSNSKFLYGPAAALLGLVSLAVQAQSADYQMPTSIHDWTGGYVGGHIGYIAGDFDYDATPFAGPRFTITPDGIAGGILAGYNWQRPSNWVFGIEADGTIASASETLSFVGAGFPITAVNAEIKWLATLRGRVGYAFDNTLLFASLGIGALRTETIPTGGPVATFGKTHIGVVGTVGGEWAVSETVSLRGEYMYGNFATENLGGTFANLKPEIHYVRGAIVWNLR